MIDKFLEIIQEKDILQHKYLEASINDLGEEDREQFFDIVTYFSNLDGYDVEKLAEAYLLVVNDCRNETKYFLEHGSYRYTTFDEVKNDVYFNDHYMRQYMIGLVLSDYIWKNHLLITKWLKDQFTKMTAEGKYLEIGPGFGLYFLLAMKYTNFSEYKAVDLSPTSVEQAIKFVKNFEGGGAETVGNCMRRLFLLQGR